MTMICIADKNRLTVRGVRHGQRYLVKKEDGGWWIEAAPKASFSFVHLTDLHIQTELGADQGVHKAFEAIRALPERPAASMKMHVLINDCLQWIRLGTAIRRDIAIRRKLVSRYSPQSP